jgi:protein-S-isoprenylcysteine O-methyltransferase Ste14
MAARTTTRWVVPALFAVAAVATALGAAHHLSYALAHPAPRSFLETVYACLRALIAAAFACLTVGRAPVHRRTRDPVAFIACALAMGMAVAFRSPPAGTPELLEVFGLSIAVAACAMLALSVFSLGQCFGVLPEARGLVTSGAYSVVRHPLYAAESAAFVGLTIAAPVLANAVLLAVLLGAQFVRMRFEEQALTDAFPEYARYARTVPAIVPSPRKLLDTARAHLQASAAGRTEPSADSSTI